MKIEINPALSQIVDYIWFDSKKPLSMNAGQLTRSYVDGKVLKAEFCITYKEASESDRWDANNERVMLQVLDARGCPIIESWLPMKGMISKTGTLCLGDTSE